MDDRHHFMLAALSLSRRNLGQTWPNPSVGALLVKDGQIIAQGWTGRKGRPHAETVATQAAGQLAKGATLYVTLEPCSHHGKTPPCVDAIIKAGITQVVVACRDPHPEHGGGIAKLKAAGIDVVEGVLEKEAHEINAGFFSIVEKQRPFVAIKIATSMDEKITRGKDEDQWITSEPARAYGHLLRSRYDAILTGIGTVLADDPLLTCRLPGLEDRSPVRVILDRKHQLPKDCQIAVTQKRIPTWVLDLPTIPSVLLHLMNQGVTRVLVEGGQKITTAFLESGLVDKVYWFRAPTVVGSKGLSAVTEEFPLAYRLEPFRHAETRQLSTDTLEVLCLAA